MSNRSIKKMRLVLKAPSFAQRVQAGMSGSCRKLWESLGWGWNEKANRPTSKGGTTMEPLSPEARATLDAGLESGRAALAAAMVPASLGDFTQYVADDEEEHVHGEHCKHDHE